MKWHLSVKILVPYSQDFIFFATLRIDTISFIRLEILVRDKHSSLLDSFISYEENKVLGIWSLVDKKHRTPAN
jgi:hypothetical protein